MKTLFVVSEVKLLAHAGEEYDDYIVVDNEVTTDTIAEWAHRIHDRVRKLWAEDDGSEHRCVVVTLDAPLPYRAILQESRHLLKEQFGIVVDLPFLTPEEKFHV